MCGIAGFYNPKKITTDISRATLDALHTRIEHRGPDGNGIYLTDDHTLGLVHRRLSIIDLSDAASQPMWNTEKTLVIVYNGEIYNHFELKQELEGLGYRYQSASDTETILHAYDAWGIDALHKMRGMFSFALFDTRTRDLYLVRDRFGIKPMYLSNHAGIWSFASEIKAFSALPWIHTEINEAAISHYLTFMITPSPTTLYKNMYKLPAGYYLKIGGDGQYQATRWYNPIHAIQTTNKSDYADEQTCIERTRDLLETSIKEHMMSDVPVGAFLSGGVDSSLNVALMAKHGQKLKTFTVAMESSATHELAWARTVAEQCGTEHHEIIISDAQALEVYEKMVYHTDEPLADCVNIPFYFVAQEARRQGVVVAQVGEGADELFFGYPLYAHYARLMQQLKPLKYVPESLKKFGATLIKSAFPHHVNYQDLAVLWAHNRPLFLGGAIAFNQSQKKYLPLPQEHSFDSFVDHLYPGFPQAGDSASIIEYHLRTLTDAVPEADFAQHIMYLELVQRLPELLLMRADKMAMMASLEARVPFLDHRLVEYLFAMPQARKVPGLKLKYILKKVAEGIIPHEIIYRTKVGFAAPVMQWFKPGAQFEQYFSAQNRHAQGAYVALHKAYQHAPFVTSPYNRAVQQWTLQNLLTSLTHHEKSLL